MKRSFLSRQGVLLASGLGLIAATYGLVRLAYGLFLPDVQRDLGLGAGAAGWISSGASAVYCVGAVAGLLLAARVPRVLVAAAALVAGAGALGMATAAGPPAFGAWSVIGSAAAGLASPALVALVARQVPDAAQGRAQAVVNAGTGPGLVAAGVLALVLLPDWRTAWAWSGAFAIVVGAVLLGASRGTSDTRDTPTRAPSAPPSPAPAPALAPAPAPSPAPSSARRWLVAHRRVLVLAVLFGAGSAVVWTYGRSALVEAGAPVVVSVSAWIALGLGGAAVVVTARWTSGLRARTLWTATAGSVAVAVLALGLAPQSTTLALLACAVFGWGYTAATGSLITWTTEIAPERASAGTSMLFVALVLGQAVGAAAAGGLIGAVGTLATFAAGAVVTAGAAAGAAGARVRGVAAARSSGCTPPTPPSPRAERSRHPAAP
ncbi:Predicted arabinose efflux permease, MFS family [Curtobacterium sp. UNCCL20]|uniref:MFS transporter n=1 Tax=Curtobacterium sp. UNCCL20 TaxID=1502773 RepID=UPI0008839356|nr:MFS transporter [Curtobacterium sp. UNCCL20]SDQ59519.1 Predicted arabinose efflux permease, MFS family [Curtobacterium sp. UNCCL20]